MRLFKDFFSNLLHVFSPFHKTEYVSDWNLVAICNHCKSDRVAYTTPRYCKECGSTGGNPVLRRWNVDGYEYKKYGSYANPMSSERRG